MSTAGVGRNDRCPCGSGKKFKHCCLRNRFDGTISRPALYGDGAGLRSHPPTNGPLAKTPKPKVRIGVGYTFADAFGKAEVSYCFERGQLFVLTNGYLVDADAIRVGMEFHLEGGLVAKVTSKELPKLWDPPSQERDTYGNSLKRVVGTIKYSGFYPRMDLRLAGEIIKTTPGHEFWSESRQAWLPASALDSGEMLRNINGQLYPLEWKSDAFFEQVDLHNLEVEDFHTYFVGKSGILTHNGLPTGCSIPTPQQAVVRRAEFTFRGARRIDGLREASHADVVKAFEGTGFTPSGHFISRVIDPRTQALGVRSFRDLETIIRRGQILNAEDGLKAIVHDGMAIIFNPRTGRLVTLRPW